MELLYLWIGKYNNIEEQGFNFSGEYDFEFDYENKELKMKKNEDYKLPENFYGKNISNVTAIIGENGAGKSSLCEFFCTYNVGWNVYKEENLLKKQYIAIFKTERNEKKKKQEDYVKLVGSYYFGENVVVNCVGVEFSSENSYTGEGQTLIKKLQDNIGVDFDTVYYSNIFDARYKEIDDASSGKNLTNISTNYLVKSNLDKNRINSYEINEQNKILDFISETNDEEFKKIFSFNSPIKYYVSLNQRLFYKQYHSTYFDESRTPITIENITKMSKKIKVFKDEVMSNNLLSDEEIKKFHLIYLIVLLYVSKYVQKEINGQMFIAGFAYNYEYGIFNEDIKFDIKNPINSLGNVLVVHKQYLKEFNKYVKELKKIKEKFGIDYQTVKEKISKEEEEVLKKLDIDSSDKFIRGYSDKEDFIDEISEIEELYKILFNEIDSSEGGQTLFSLNIKSDLKKLKEIIKKSNTLFRNEKMKADEINLLNFQPDITLSSGEKSFLSIFSRLFKIINSKIIDGEGKSLIVFLDEPDIFMHPEWQRKFLKYFIEFIKEWYSDFKVQIILTSHSPLLISDLPKENVIFLEKYDKDENDQKKGNCKVVSGIERKNTFAANIHTLYNDSFFMKSTTGEFAKEKIIEILKILKKEKRIDDDPKVYSSKEEIYNTIQLIGEEVVKNKLLSMFWKEYPEYKDDVKAKALEELENPNLDKEKLRKMIEELSKSR